MNDVYYSIKMRAEREGVPVTVLDAPLLYEAGLDALCGEVWCAWIPRAVQLSRLMARDGLTRAEAEDRIRSQMSAWEKRLNPASSSRIPITASGRLHPPARSH